jgi:ribosomal protein S12 methylthiotransferase accessory factor YcaO
MLLDWLRDEGRRFRARIYDLGVIDDALPGYHDYAVNLTVGRVRYDGRGQARTAALALSKATGEAVERWLVDRCRRRGELETSSGLAVHTTARRARDNARRELIERDLFLCHLLTGTPFNPVPRRELETNAAIVHFERQCASIGIELRYGALPS